MSNTDIYARLKQTCVLFHCPDGSIGSGYIIARGYVATAAHVIQHMVEGGTEEVLVGWPPFRRSATVTLIARTPSVDAAVLRVDGCDDIEPMPVGWATGDDKWRSFGFPVAMSEDRNKVAGVHLSGTIIDMRHADYDGTPQIAVYNQEAITTMDMSGASGAAVAVGGGLVGHIVQQFRDPDNYGRSISSQLKACPMDAVIALLPAGVAPRRMAPTRKDVDIAELVAWCDRETLTSTINDWLDTKAGGAKLLCLAGHSENRQSVLLDRIGRELSSQKPNRVLSNTVHIPHALEPGNASQFRRAMLGALDITKEDRIQLSTRFRGSSGLVLLCQYCSWPESVKELEQRILQVATWLAAIQLGQRRLLFVLTIRYEDASLKRKLTEKLRKSVSAIKSKNAHLQPYLMDAPHVLDDYNTGDVRNWINLPFVKSTLGRNAERIQGELDMKFANETWNPRKLVNLVTSTLNPTTEQGGPHGGA